jgi:hypothetical protein
MAAGGPVVATPMAAEGLDQCPGPVTSETPPEFAEAIWHCLLDLERTKRFGELNPNRDPARFFVGSGLKVVVV